MDDDEYKTKISVKSVNSPLFTGSHKVADAIGRSPEVDLPLMVATALSTMADEHEQQEAAKKCNAITFAN